MGNTVDQETGLKGRTVQWTVRGAASMRARLPENRNKAAQQIKEQD